MVKKQYSKSKPVCKVTFSLTTEQVGKNAEVRVLGNFNDWSWDKGLEMKSKKKAYTASIELPAGATYEFRYLIGGHTWFNDESADDYNGTPFFSHNCVLRIDEVVIKKAPAKKAPAKKAVAKKVTPAKKAPVKKATPKKAAPATKATTRSVAAPAKPDNLTKIEGIGPKISEHLNNGGITTFALLAKATKTKLKGILDAAGPRYKMHDPTTWPKQAKLAAAGKWDELTKLQDELKGGRAK